MRHETSKRLLGIIGDGVRTLLGLTVTAAVFLAPGFLGGTGGGEAIGRAESPRRSPIPADHEFLDGWASEGFRGLAEFAAEAPRPPTWDAIRRLMEERGCTELRYAVGIRWHMADGSVEEITYIRQPYHQPEHAEEFLRVLRGGFSAWSRARGGPPPAGEGEGDGDRDGLPASP